MKKSTMPKMMEEKEIKMKMIKKSSKKVKKGKK